MKIWKATLILIPTIDETFDLRFEFEEETKPYRVNERFEEWIHSEGWISNTIPMNKTIEAAGYSGLKVTQGFEHELNKEELKQLESDMRKFLIAKLNADKEIYLQEYQMKIDLIKNMKE